MAMWWSSTEQNSLYQYANFGEGQHALVVGGQGYVGTHTVLRMLEEGYVVSVIDNSSTSTGDSLDRVKDIVGEERAQNLNVYPCDITDKDDLSTTMVSINNSTSMRVDVCVHFGCLTLVGESTRMPLRYHQNNVAGTLNLLEVLEKHGVREIVFSSSAAVYGDAPQPRGPDGRWGGLTESSRVGQGIATAYARSMLMVEQVLEDLHKSPAGKSWGIMILRYFSPVAAHPSGRIGEDPTRPPNNLLPYVAQVAVGRRDFLTVFGDDYETHDGTLARDYIHVMDVAEGHLGALKKLHDFKTGMGEITGADDSGFHIYNLGIGDSTTVMDMVEAMEKASGLKVETRVKKRRQEEAAEVYLDASKAEAELGWKATRDLGRMCEDLWRWQNLNPQGYKKDPSKATFGAFKAPSFQANRPKLSSLSTKDHEEIGTLGSTAHLRRNRDSRSFIASASVQKKVGYSGPPNTTSESAASLTQLQTSMRGRGLSMDSLPAEDQQIDTRPSEGLAIPEMVTEEREGEDGSEKLEDVEDEENVVDDEENVVDDEENVVDDQENVVDDKEEEEVRSRSSNDAKSDAAVEDDNE